MTAPSQPPAGSNGNSNTNLNINGNGGGRRPHTRAETIGATVIVLALFFYAWGVLIPVVIIGAIVVALWLVLRHLFPIAPTNTPTPTPAPTPPTPPYPDVLGNVCQHCGATTDTHVAPDGRMLDVRVFHGLPPRG